MFASKPFKIYLNVLSQTPVNNFGHQRPGHAVRNGLLYQARDCLSDLSRLEKFQNKIKKNKTCVKCSQAEFLGASM